MILRLIIILCMILQILKGEFNNAFLCLLSLILLFKKSKIDELLNMGFDGIEAIYIQNTKEDTENFINLALKNNLLISAGSDCHGNSKDDTKHGDIGNIVYNNNYLDSFISAYERK